MCLDAGVDFIKTSTGYAPEGAKTHIIEIIRKTVGRQAGIKASGGIKTKEFALSLIDAGANRIGTSSHPEVFI
jgi:deoxyribose-phosphate aldolase